MKSFDMFEVPIPAFNFKADESIKTTFGAAVSYILAVTVFLYATIKTI